MKLEITSTPKVIEIDGVTVRLWHGKTRNGTRCVVFVKEIAVHNDDDAKDFEAELREVPPPAEYLELERHLNDVVGRSLCGHKPRVPAECDLCAEAEGWPRVDPQEGRS